MVKTTRNLERAGADFVVMPCNTAHYYYEDLKKSIGIPILNMIELTARVINKSFHNVRRVGSSPPLEQLRLKYKIKH